VAAAAQVTKAVVVVDLPAAAAAHRDPVVIRGQIHPAHQELLVKVVPEETAIIAGQELEVQEDLVLRRVLLEPP
jgi:hypothetical protein